MEDRNISIGSLQYLPSGRSHRTVLKISPIANEYADPSYSFKTFINRIQTPTKPLFHSNNSCTAITTHIFRAGDWYPIDCDQILYNATTICETSSVIKISHTKSIKRQNKECGHKNIFTNGLCIKLLMHKHLNKCPKVILNKEKEKSIITYIKKYVLVA